MSKYTIIAVLILIGAFIAVNYDKKQASAPIVEDTVACTMDAKECSDGSFVGRTGPNCEFVCPNIKPKPIIKPVVTVGTVKGQVVASPGCGNPPAGGSCPPIPFKTTVLFFNDFSRYTTTSDQNGFYSIDIPEGSYQVQATDGEPYPKCSIQTTIVKKSKTNTLDIFCDSGFL